MTVISKLNETMEMLKSTESNCRTFSLDTDDPNAKQLFSQIAESVKVCENMLQSRINFVMSEEPQYQPQQQQQQIQQQIQMQQQQQQQQ
ncbi:DUF1657 domain-containing protein [Clostridium niameyense]|uniref:DUF1657 domain-containing protein n=1 Tax=Clostridium niameyense TaxID=1622073 RepID=A0A6M0R9L7_9CLOT|nr:DUF1657 domain-containing protein [Clostridium niameyense]NEZ46467.1 DUF1657 domain-containing protein [Clostridium niameyense]